MGRDRGGELEGEGRGERLGREGGRGRWMNQMKIKIEQLMGKRRGKVTRKKENTING